MTAPAAWRATVSIVVEDDSRAERLRQALTPEAEREVPRARTHVSRPRSDTVELSIEARDTGALRAALNTYLGWVELVRATEAVAHER